MIAISIEISVLFLQAFTQHVTEAVRAYLQDCYGNNSCVSARCFEDILAIAETVARVTGSIHVARTLVVFYY